jgi:hypothetical protein
MRAEVGEAVGDRLQCVINGIADDSVPLAEIVIKKIVLRVAPNVGEPQVRVRAPCARR